MIMGASLYCFSRNLESYIWLVMACRGPSFRAKSILSKFQRNIKSRSFYTLMAIHRLESCMLVLFARPSIVDPSLRTSVLQS